MSKRLLSVFLVLCMLASVLSGMVALAGEPIYTTSSIFFGYADGDAWTDATALEAGKTLTSKIEVSKTGDVENMIFALVVYESNKLISADSATKAVAEDTVTFEASVELPDDVDNTHVVAVLWDNVTDMNAIANSSIFPGGSADLEAIYIDGKVIDGFNPDVKEYLYNLPTGGNEVAPVITAKPVDSGAKVEVGEAIGFPGTVTLKVTAPGGVENSYVIKYGFNNSTSGFIADKKVYIMNEDNEIPQAYGGGVATPLAKLVEGGLTLDSVAYSDRDYKTTAIMDESLIGLDKVIGGIGWYNASTPTATAFKSKDALPWVNFVLTRGATIMVFFADKAIEAQPKFEQYGYELETNTDGYFTNSLNAGVVMKHIYKFHRHYKAGETVTVPNALQGNNTYTILISYDPYGYVAPINHTALSGITVDGVELDGFEEEVKSYDYVLPADQADIPEVAVTTLDPKATAVISKPTAFPGKTTITVKCEGHEDSVYTINYSVGGTGNIKMLETFNNEAIKWDGVYPAMYSNLQNGAYCWSDRLTSPKMIMSNIDDSLKGNTYIIGALNWQNGPETNNYKLPWAAQEFIPDFYTFDLGRSATVKVIAAVAPTSAKGKAFAETGYETSTDSNGYISMYTDKAISYNYMYTKKFEVTDTPVKVSMPNFGGSPYVVVIEYATYESLEGLTPADIPSTELTTLTVDGVEVEGFSPAKTEYNVALTSQNIPTVAASALYKNAVVTVEQPVALPGTATVTVEAEGLDTATYTINFTLKTPDGYVEGMSISNANIEMRTTKRAGWNTPLNKDNFDYVYKKTIDVEEGSTKTITLEIANKPYQKGIVIVKPTQAGLEDKTAIVNADGTPIEWKNDTSVARAYDYENYPEYNVAGVTYGKVSTTKPVTMGSGSTYPVYKEMFASDNKYVSGARTHNSRHPISAGTAVGGDVSEWEDCNYIVFENHLDPAQSGSGTDNTDTVTFTVDKDVEVVFLTTGKAVSVKEVGVDSAAWAPVNVYGINRIYMNWVDSITVAYLIYNGYITQSDVIGNYGKVGNGDLGILIRDRSALEAFFADWKAENGVEPLDGVQIKESDKAKTGFVNDSATYHHDVFLYAWIDEADVPQGSTLLTDLKIDGKTVEGFTSSVINYSINIPGSTDTTKVTYTTEDEDATATVDTTTPGVIKVTVKKDGFADTVYTVEYKVVNFTNVKMKETYNGAALAWGDAVAKAKTNLQVGDKCYSDRGNANMIFSYVAPEFVGKDWIQGALNWPNGGNNAYATLWRDATYYNDFYTFDLYSSALVTLITSSDAKKANLEAEGWTYAKDTDNGYLVGYTDKAVAYTHKFTKYIDTTDGIVTVGIPNTNGASNFVVFDFEAEKPEEGGDEPGTPDTPVVPPVEEDTTALSALSVNGTAVAGFKADTLEYTVTIPDAQADFPVVTYTTKDEDATAVVTNPTEFPGKATVTVSKDGLEDTTYTINYSTSTNGVLVGDLKLSDKAGISAGHSVWPTTARNLQEGDLLYLGRSYKVTTINDEFAKGKDRIMTAVGWGSDVKNNYSIAFRGELINDWVSFTALRGMDVIVYDDHANDGNKFKNLGYKQEYDADCFIYAQLNMISEGKYNEAKHTYKYTKHYAAGETVNIPNAANNQAYLIVLDYDNYASLIEEEVEPISTKLSAITVNGTAVANFNADTTTYEVKVASNVTSAVVAATAQDAKATVTVAQAEGVPGTATITVTGEGSETTIYTVNITRDLTEEEIYNKAELTITDNDVEPREVKRGGLWNEVIGVTNFNNKYTKEFTVEAGATKTVSLDVAGLKHQQGIIVVKPLGDGEDKNAIVNADGSALSWTDDARTASTASHGGTIESYNYENYPEYNEAGATWAKITSNKPVKVTFNGSEVTFPVMQKLIESDGKYVNGARAQTDRRPSDGAIHFTDVDDAWLGSNYFVFDNTDRSAGFTVEFTINKSAEVILLTNNGSVTIKETGSDAAWTKQATTAVREHASPVDEITIASMIYHGILNENQFADKSTYEDAALGVKVTGRRIKNLSAFREYMELLTEMYGKTSKFGIQLKESAREATGFTDTTKDYTYKDYLYNWEDAEIVQPEPDPEPVSTKLSAITVNGVAVTGFNADTLTYNVELGAGTASATVAATAADSKATVTVAQAAALPGTATITVKGEGSTDTVYTVNITVAAPVVPDEPENTNPVQNVTMLAEYDGAVIPWGGAVAKYKTNLQVGDYCYSDRSGAMKWSSVAEEFQGKDWIQGALDWPNGGTKVYATLWDGTTVTPNYYTFDLHKSAMITIVVSNSTYAGHLVDAGWKHESNSAGYLIGYTNTTVAYCHKYSKYFKVEDEAVTVSIPNIKGSVSATVVLDYEAVPEIITTLSDLTLDGETIEDFAGGTYEYFVPLAPGADIPVVGYELLDENATAEVVQATEVPGTATITVTGNEGEEPTVYTVNFYEYVEKNISFDDLEARGTKTHSNAAVAVLYNTATNDMYAYGKEYDVAEGETKTITLSATGLVNQYAGIVLVPTGDYADADVVVTADGGDITWNDYSGQSVAEYAYTNDGAEEFDAANATYTQYSTDGVSATVDGAATKAWVVNKMHYSDNMYVNGAPAVTDRNPSRSGICWIEFPEDWEDCQYITFPSGVLAAAKATEVTFTVNAPVKVILFTANKSASVKDAEDTENWAGEKVAMTRRYMHGVDNLTVAYLIKKGYISESDITGTGIAFGDYATTANVGYYLRRYDALLKLEEDFGANYGVVIKEDALAGTGFVNLGADAKDYYIRDYTYQDFLDAWADDE